MQRAFLFIVTWVIAAIIVMSVFYVAFKLFLKAKKEYQKSEKENIENEE